MPPTLFEVSNITSIEYLIVSYHFKCQGIFQAFTNTFFVGHFLAPFSHYSGFHGGYSVIHFLSHILLLYLLISYHFKCQMFQAFTCIFVCVLFCWLCFFVSAFLHLNSVTVGWQQTLYGSITTNIYTKIPPLSTWPPTLLKLSAYVSLKNCRCTATYDFFKLRSKMQMAK